MSCRATRRRGRRGRGRSGGASGSGSGGGGGGGGFRRGPDAAGGGPQPQPQPAPSLSTDEDKYSTASSGDAGKDADAASGSKRKRPTRASCKEDDRSKEARRAESNRQREALKLAETYAKEAWEASGQEQQGSDTISVEGSSSSNPEPTRLCQLLGVLLDPACKVEQKEQLVVHLRGGTTSADISLLEDGVYGCIWHERASTLSSARDLGVATGQTLDACLFDKLLEKGVAFVISKPTSKRRWKLGILEDKIKGKKNSDRFANLNELLKCTRGSHNNTRRLVIPNQGSQFKGDVVAWRTTRGGENGEHKILHWPICQCDQECRGESKGKNNLGTCINSYPTLPSLLATNWLDTSGKDKTYKPKLQLVHAHQWTEYHFDNGGTDTWMKVLAGQVLVACWSMDYGKRFELDDPHRHPLDWDKIRKMPSARLFLLSAEGTTASGTDLCSQGDVLVMPSGTFHYIYTVKPKIVIAGDFLDGSCKERRFKVVEEGIRLGVRGASKGKKALEEFYKKPPS